jgi:LacI family transcriptional regulator
MENDNKKLKKAVRLQDIADRCGISKMAVSLALRDDPSISDTTKQQVKSIAIELGYHPGMHDAARRLTAQKTGQRIRTNTIGVILPPNFSDSPLSGAMFHGILDCAVPAGFALLTTYYNFTSLQSYMENPIIPVPPIFATGGIDGFIVFDISKNVAETVAFLEHKTSGIHYPVVVVMGKDARYSSVNIDYQHGGYELTTHLLRLGHRHFLRYTNNIDNKSFEPVIQGTCQALSEAGLSPEKHLHYIDMPNKWIMHNPHENYRNIDNITNDQNRLINKLCQHPEITAITAWNDSSAIITCNLLRDAGISIPDDISVSGYDDIYPYMNLSGENELTAVHVPFKEIGHNAMILMIEQINNQLSVPTHIVIPPEIMPRKTTGPAKVKVL